MSYIELSTPDLFTKKAIISLWFRVPSSTFEEVSDEFFFWNYHTTPRRDLLGIVPLMVWGPMVSYRQFEYVSRSLGSSTRNHEHWQDGADLIDCSQAGWVHDYSETIALGTAIPQFTGKGLPRDPSYIGIDCTGAYPALSVNIRSQNRASMIGSWPVAFGESLPTHTFRTGGGVCPGAPQYVFDDRGHCMVPIETYTHTLSMKGTANIVLGAEPETFRLLPHSRTGDTSADVANQMYNGKEVSLDHWHHLLLSFDFSGGITTRGTLTTVGATLPSQGARVLAGAINSASIWIAFDDENLTGEELSVYSPGGNRLLSVNGYWVAADVLYAGSSTSTDCFGNLVTDTTVQSEGAPFYALGASTISFVNLGLPSNGIYFDAIRRVEMGELQMFSDISFDTKEEENRRAFITDEGKPETLKQTQEFIGKKPEILLHGSRNWQDAKNTGNLAADPPEKGTHVGLIDTYKPNPSLHGPQGLPS